MPRLGGPRLYLGQTPGGVDPGLGWKRAAPPHPASPAQVCSSGLAGANKSELESLLSGHTAGLVLGLGPGRGPEPVGNGEP